MKQLAGRLSVSSTTDPVIAVNHAAPPPPILGGNSLHMEGGSYKQYQYHHQNHDHHDISTAAQYPGACRRKTQPSSFRSIPIISTAKYVHQSANQIVMPQDQHALILASLVPLHWSQASRQNPGFHLDSIPRNPFQLSNLFLSRPPGPRLGDSEVDHLKFSYDGQDLVIPEGSLSTWYSPQKDVKVERLSGKNSAIITLKDKAEIMVTAVPVTKQDDKIHSYRLPANDCFVHFEVQFKFFHLSSKVDGVLGRTYRPDFENPAKPGVAMPVLGGENNYRIASLFSTDCNSCIFSPESGSNQETSPGMNYGTLDCTKGASAGYGIVCRK
ncbi:hypothetical protein OIU84_003037 [Salix udensis]|uniref:Uncharacterized protein n=1 Tax=Salix udensis TaxID=889485 RepID=A0AAD6K5D4_9ROSI|nr:hypothetical protein OIU84_003037 [Salix udensis]